MFAIFLGSSRGIVNLDYLFSLLIGSNYINIAYLILVSCIDVLWATSNAYHFTPISFLENYQIISNFNYISNPSIIFLIIFGVIFIFTSCKIINNLIWNVSLCRVICTLTLVALILIIDLLLGTFNGIMLTTKPILPNPLNINISTSGVGYLMNEYYSRHVKIKGPQEFRSIESSLAIALQNVDPGKKPENIVLVIIESFGLINNSKIQQELTKKFSEAIKINHQIESGSVQFFGATTSAEIRELCGIKSDYKFAMSKSNFDNCIPNKLKNFGYSTNGLHYYFRSAFSRDLWWPNIGLDNIKFLDEYNKKKCGGIFDGGCDAMLIADLFSTLNSKEKIFSYGLTLNSHFPIHNNEYISSIDDSRLSEFDNLPSEISMLVKSWMVVLDSVANEVNQYPDRDMLVVIVGDHSPPFLSESNRSIFNKEKVPYIIIRTGKY